MRGGVVRIRSSGLAQRLYIPIKNVIRDFCERYMLQSLAGELLFEVDPKDSPQPDGERSSRMRLLVREKTNDPQPIGELVIGEQSGDTSLSLVLRGSGARNATQVVGLTVDKAGNMSIVAKANFDVQADAVGLHGKTSAALTSDRLVRVAAPEVELGQDSGNVTVRGERIKIGGDLAFQKAVLGEALYLWMISVTAKANNPALPAPVTVPPRSTVLSGKVYLA